jgi:diaminopimelate epimerase
VRKMKHTFIKMHGLGNDFVILDLRHTPFEMTPERVQWLADRRFGIGCDQVITLESPTVATVDAFMRIYNPDGIEVGACGNATRCVGSLLAQELRKDTCILETIEGLLRTSPTADGTAMQVDMGPPRLKWEDIPLSEACDTLHLPIQLGVLRDPAAVSMGNPHMVFFVKDVQGIDIDNLGKQLTTHPLYPQRANVEVVEVLNRQTLRVRVYERGTGVTLACGTGACASAVAAHLRGLAERQVTVILDGGTLDISYGETVKITGPVGYAFEGHFDTGVFEQVKDLCPPTSPVISKSLPLDAV